jgi:hypothetical protein
MGNQGISESSVVAAGLTWFEGMGYDILHRGCQAKFQVLLHGVGPGFMEDVRPSVKFPHASNYPRRHLHSVAVERYASLGLRVERRSRQQTTQCLSAHPLQPTKHCLPTGPFYAWSTTSRYSPTKAKAWLATSSVRKSPTQCKCSTTGRAEGMQDQGGVVDDSPDRPCHDSSSSFSSSTVI